MATDDGLRLLGWRDAVCAIAAQLYRRAECSSDVYRTIYAELAAHVASLDEEMLRSMLPSGDESHPAMRGRDAFALEAADSLRPLMLLRLTELLQARGGTVEIGATLIRVQIGTGARDE